MKLILIDLKYTLLTSVGVLYQEYHAESKNESYTAEKETYRENKYYTTEKETYRELVTTLVPFINVSAEIFVAPRTEG